jgi:hypothetical protein
LGFILLLIYIPAVWNWAFSNNYEIGVIKTATLEITIPVQGLLTRREYILKSPGDGVVIPEIQYGDRTAKGSAIASYIRTDARDVVDNYRQMEIEILKRVVAEFDSTSGPERELWEGSIETQIAKLTELSNSGDMSNASAVRSAVDHILESKARYLLENDNLGSSLKSEKQELERLKNSINKSVTSINSTVSGIVSYQCDGFEGTVSPEKRYEISIEQVNEALKKENSAESPLTPAEIGVSKDQIFGKIVLNNEGWITFFVPESNGSKISVLYEKSKLDNKELTYDLELEGLSDRIPVTMEKIDGPKDGFTKITARMTKYIEKTMNLRGVKGNLVLQSVTGMKVPLRSLFNENSADNTADIAVVEMNKVKFKRVQIAGREDSYAIIENIDQTDTEENVNIFDIYLVNPKNVVEGQVIEG